MSNKDNLGAFVKSVGRWDSGGGIELDIIELDDGQALVVTDETVSMYLSVDDFWEEANEAGNDERQTLTILRETGKLLEFAPQH